AGTRAPVSAGQVAAPRGARTRLEVEAERGLTPLVGRERELALLEESFARAAAGRGQVVFVVGEPGIGKSRLLAAFRRRVSERSSWLEGHCLSFGQSMALHPLVDLLSRHLGIGRSEERRGGREWSSDVCSSDLRRRVSERSSWLEGHCLSFGQSMALHPLVDLLSRHLGIG